MIIDYEELAIWLTKNNIVLPGKMICTAENLKIIIETLKGALDKRDGSIIEYGPFLIKYREYTKHKEFRYTIFVEVGQENESF